ncbi:MAG TPA: site-2 protease family protein [Aquifex aeolicus]|nr:site-2 protease family protein [Aquificales bacterium]HIP86265.1 site-2 protease family protein [Aquifex sp.]HIQ26280.1 site-2 protease family protein [Aquifex aeolicus]
MLDLFIGILQLTALIFIFSFHNYIKALAAVRLGDDTPKRSGFLTLNPIPHIDIFGTLILPAIFILLKSPLILGWPKVVPIDYSRLHKSGGLILTVVSIVSYFLIAGIGYILYKVVTNLSLPYTVEAPLATLFQFITIISSFFGFLNLFPIPPLDMGIILLLLFGKKMYEIQSYSLWGSLAVIILFVSGIFGYLFQPFYKFLISLF